MVASAEAVLPLETLRTELRIPSGDTEHDGIIYQHRQAAIDWIEEETQRSIMDRSMDLQLVYQYDDEPLDIGKVPDLKKDITHQINWWRFEDSIWEAPTQTRPAGRFTEYTQHRWRVYPFENQWPPAQKSMLIFKLETGMNEVPAAFQQATILWARALYNGNATLPERATVLRLLEPFMAVS